MSLLLAGILLIPSCSDDDYQFTHVVLTEVNPVGGPPGTTVTVIGRGFSRVPEEHTVTIGELPAEVLAATDTALVIPRFFVGPGSK